VASLYSLVSDQPSVSSLLPSLAQPLINTVASKPRPSSKELMRDVKGEPFGLTLVGLTLSAVTTYGYFKRGIAENS